MHLDENVDVVADGVAHGEDVVDGAALDGLVDESPPRPRHGIELHGREAAFGHGLGLLAEFRRRPCAPRPAVGVDADRVPAGPAQQAMDRHPGRLADDVPKRLLDAADGAVVVHAAATRGEVVVGALGQLADPGRVATDHIAGKRVEVRGDLQIAVALRVALAPAMDALVRIDPHEAEVLAAARMDNVMTEACDLHRLRRSLGRLSRRRP